MPEVPAPLDSPGAALEVLDERVAPLVEAVARAARDAGSPAVRLERALEILFGAYAGSDPGFSALLLEGWVRAQRDKQYRLRLAWQREQLRLLLQDILAEGAVRGLFRSGLDAGAVAAVIVGTAEGCLLQSATEGGAVSPAELSRALFALMLRGA
jgi:BetI-type transcriptional repressor, C-terminal